MSEMFYMPFLVLSLQNLRLGYICVTSELGQLPQDTRGSCAVADTDVSEGDSPSSRHPDPPWTSYAEQMKLCYMAFNLI